MCQHTVWRVLCSCLKCQASTVQSWWTWSVQCSTKPPRSVHRSAVSCVILTSNETLPSSSRRRAPGFLLLCSLCMYEYYLQCSAAVGLISGKIFGRCGICWGFPRRPEDDFLVQVKSKTDVTPAILSCNFVVQLHRATKLQVWHGVSHNFSTVVQLQFCATLLWKCGERWLVNSCLCDKVAECDIHSCILQLCRAIKLRDKITQQNCRCDIGLIFVWCIKHCNWACSTLHWWLAELLANVKDVCLTIAHVDQVLATPKTDLPTPRPQLATANLMQSAVNQTKVNLQPNQGR